MNQTTVFASVQPNRLTDVTQALSSLKGITWYAPVTGRFDLAIQFNATETEQVYALVNKIRAINGITATSTFVPFQGATNGKHFKTSDSLALVLLQVSGQAENVLQRITKLPNVYSAFVVPGEFDIIATLYGANYEALLSQAMKIGQTQGITSSETLFAYKPVWA